MISSLLDDPVLEGLLDIDHSNVCTALVDDEVIRGLLTLVLVKGVYSADKKVTPDVRLDI